MERDRIFQRLPQGTELKLPATWLSHGYQSSLAWLSDLLGHFLLEDSTFDRAKKAAPSELQGLVLIDELDMHLHPTWQTTFVAALRETFPNIQFIVTTHSPLLLSGLRPEEIVLLELDDESGAIVRREFEELDPRLMTGSEIFQEFFELDTVWSQELGRILDDYNFWSQNPHRDEHHDKMLEQWRSRLMEEGVPVNEPVEKSEP